MVERPNCDFVFLIDTNQYAGNFEREMVAYISGRIGECEVGLESSKDFQAEETEKSFFEMEELVALVSEGGCSRPSSIWINHVDGQYNSVAMFLHKPPNSEQVEMFMRRAKKFAETRPDGRHYAKQSFTIYGFRLLKFEFNQSTIASWSVE